MALVVGTNSFISLAGAESYFENRLDITPWSEADDPSKESALVTATSLLNGSNWVGYTEDTAQALAFPRVGTYLEPIHGQYVDFEGIPKRILDATCETALHQLINEGVLDSSGSSLDVLKVGPITLEGRIGQSGVNTLPGLASSIIRPMLAQGGNAWWRAN